jgi:hypothetical protein
MTASGSSSRWPWATPVEVVDRTGLAVREAAIALDRLTRGGLVVPVVDDRVRLATERVR